MGLEVSRRGFLAATVATAAAVQMRAGGETMKGPWLCVFSKHLQFLDYAALAKTCKDLGLDGVDLTVRKGGHVEPWNLATDLPKALEIIRAEGLEVPMITAKLVKGSDPTARPILEAAAKSNVRYVRIDWPEYSDKGNPLDELPRFTQDLREMALIAQDQGVTLGFHNHSGTNNVGSVLWDLQRMLADINLPSVGSNFDIGHATVVGGLDAWRIHARLMSPYVKMMAVKDFVWKGDKAEWVPLGEGIVKPVDYFKTFRE